MLADHRVLKGEDVGPVPGNSLAQHIFPKIKALPKDQIFQVEAETGNTQTVYENLTKSVRLSEGLRKLGLKENDVVSIVCRNSFAADEIVLATWLSGAAIAPITHQIKTVEMKHLFNLFEPKFVFTEEPFAELVTSALESLSSSVRVIIISKKNSESSHMCLEDVRVDVDIDSYRPLPVTSPATQLVGILASSGSTGLPKGVGVTHTNLIFQEMILAKIKPFGHFLPCLQISAYFWLTGILLYLRALVSGMKRILLKTSSSENVLLAIDKHKPAWTLLGPQLMLSITEDPDFEKYDVSSMQLFLLGGSPFLKNVGEKILAKWGREKFCNAYGATEATGVLLTTEDADVDIYALGKPTPGVQIKFVDLTTGEAVQANTIGELCAKSPGIMWGYVKNEEENRLVIDSDGWLHTGDLGYYNDLGHVYMVDRIKAMIKVMNMQISPAEVENVIAAIPGVLEAGVAGVTHDGNDYKIKALVVKRKDSPVTEDDISAYVADTLADYKRLTGGVNFVESLPKTASGKLKRKELNQMAQALFIQ